MRKLLAALLLALLPAASALADTAPTIITPGCGVAANGSTTQPLISVGTLSASIARNPQTGPSYGLPAAATCGAVTIRSNSGSAMTDTVPAASTYGAGWMWIADGDASATDTLSGGFSGGLQAGQNVLLVSDGSAWSQAGGSYFSSASQARTNLGLGSIATVNSPVPVANGGTGTGTAGATAANNIGALAQGSNLSDLASASTARTNLGLGTAATQNTGTSGANVPLLSTANTWTTAQTMPVPVLPSQTANQVYAAPNGSAGAPGFRALVGADLPNPSASTLGGVQSAAPISNQWINSISTGGVPALSQPGFSNLSGSATLAQLPNLNAYQVYCNPTGSAASPVNCQTVFHSKDFGATGNGSTDDTTNLQAWLTACGTQHALCILDQPSGYYKISSALTISGATVVVGAATNARIAQSSATADTIDINANYVTISNIEIAPVSAQTAGNCVNVGTSTTTYILTNLDLIYEPGFICFNGIYANNAASFSITRANVSGSNYAIAVGAGGDSSIENSTGITGEVAGVAFLNSQATGGGGLRIVNNKFNVGVASSEAILLTMSSGVNAADLIVADNSIEGYPVGVALTKGSGTTFASVAVIDNEFAITTSCLTTDANSGWLSQVQFSNNLCGWSQGGSSVGVSIGASTAGFAVQNNLFNGESGTGAAVAVASGASNGAVANNQIVSSGATAFIINASATTKIVDNNGIPFASLPTAAAVGSQVYVTNGTAGTSTCNGSGTGTMAFRVNSGTPAWRCF